MWESVGVQIMISKKKERVVATKLQGAQRVHFSDLSIHQWLDSTLNFLLVLSNYSPVFEPIEATQVPQNMTCKDAALTLLQGFVDMCFSCLPHTSTFQEK